MPAVFTVPPGHPVAQLAATRILSSVGESNLPKVILFVPNRRAAGILREAFLSASRGKPLMLPRILPIADLKNELPSLLGPSALDAIAALPPAMPEWQRLYLLAAQVRSFERGRGGEASLEQALRLATDLARLQDAFIRADQPLTMERLRSLVSGDFAGHWQQSLSFLSIVAERWPEIERECSMATEESCQHAAIALLLEQWEQTPPDGPVFVVGSTASQPMTAAFMQAVAKLEQGAIILPGFTVEKGRLDAVRAGHPYFHLLSFLNRIACPPDTMEPLAETPGNAGVWLQALGDTTSWRRKENISWDHLKLIPCQHTEEEARVIALLMREAAGTDMKRTALVTPDEELMARVAAQLARYGIAVDRLATGTLAGTATGSLFLALLEAIRDAERLLPLLNLLRHDLVAAGPREAWQRWLAAAEPAFRGVVTSRPGDLPSVPDILQEHPATTPVRHLVRELHALSRRYLRASEWVTQLAALLKPLVPQSGSGQEAVTEALDHLASADLLGPLDCEGFQALLKRQLETPWREPVRRAHANLFMLTPVEARLMQFDRVILAGMEDTLWPGIAAPGPWLNFMQQQALGLAAPEEHTSLMAHDLLMLGSMEEVFLTWPERVGGAPATRSPFIERLVAFLALQGVEETAIIADRYLAIARQLYAAGQFTPASPPEPRPATRPARLRVTALDKLFEDPYSIYAEYVLGLKPLKAVDAEPEAKDFGSIAHRAIQQLTRHWDSAKTAADEATLRQITEAALRQFSHRPNVQVFWQNRLLNALRFVNAQESLRRNALQKVKSEKDEERKIVLAADRTLELHGRIDRLEMRKDGLTIADYKTGEAPGEKDIEQGKAVQLLAYAMLLIEGGQKVEAVEYWQLPRANQEGVIRPTPAERVEALLPALRAALLAMLDKKTPFLARPLAANERYDNDYDGISRYDEWAG